MAPVNYCSACGTVSTSLSRCGGCKEVWYCSKEHQKNHWRTHKPACLYAKENPECIVIRVEAGEGSGLTNRRSHYQLKNKEEALGFIQNCQGMTLGRPLRSEFCELLGWYVEIYCNATTNTFFPPGSMVDLDGQRRLGLNSAGIYLGCSLSTGLTKYNNLDGEICVIGRRIKDGKCMNKDILWGILNFIWDAMDFYGDEPDPMSEISQLARQYRDGTWEPSGSFGGVDIYSTDASDLSSLA